MLSGVMIFFVVSGVPATALFRAVLPNLSVLFASRAIL